MSSLPPALAPWRRPLSELPRDLAVGLGPLVQRLAQAVGPLRPARQAPSGEVDGFDGLARRGSYERLLLTEWLLADELPDEFLRRATTGEHAFLHPARREPGRTRRSVALFDAGPGQLGGPRLVQLALLVVLAARAEAAGVRLAWGLLQAPGLLREDLTGAGLMALLQGRTDLEPSPGHLEAWAAALSREGPAPRAADDLWVVGAAPASAALRAASTVALGDVLEPGVLRVEALVSRPGSAPRRVELPLPPREATVRLLRDPLREASAPPADGEDRFPGALPDPASPLLLSPDGSLVLVRLRDGGLVGHRVPGSPRVRPGRSFRVPLGKGTRVVAAGYAWGARWMALASPSLPGMLVVSRIGKQGRRASKQYAAWEDHEAAGAPLRPLLPDVFEGPHGLYLLEEARLSRVRVAPAPVKGPVGSGAPPMVWNAALEPRGGRLVVAAQGAPHTNDFGVLTTRPTEHVRGEGWVWEVRTQAPAPHQCFFGEGRHLADPRLNLAALRVAPSHFRLLARWDSGGRDWLEVPPGLEPCGVAVETGAAAPSLVTMTADRHALVALQPRPGRPPLMRTLLTTASPILQVATTPGTPAIALHTAGGEVLVYSVKYQAVLLRVRHTEAP
jgi:hypothetical protein